MAKRREGKRDSWLERLDSLARDPLELRAAVIAAVFHRIASERSIDRDSEASARRELLRGLSLDVRAADADESVTAVVSSIDCDWSDPDSLGTLFETLRAAEPDRRSRGRYFTPPRVVDRVVQKVKLVHADRPVYDVLDPAMGSGRFLLAARKAWPEARLRGFDIDPWAVYVARLVVFLAGENDVDALVARLICGDTLALEPGLHPADVVIGNPPWVAHQGRQTVALSESSRLDYRLRYRSFAGFATTHAMFVEWSARALRSRGVLGLLVPTQMADLAGYGPSRAALTRCARVIAPLDELGFKQFEDVTEPTVMLIAQQTADAVPTDAPWILAESGDHKAPMFSTKAISVVDSLRKRPTFSDDTFGEAGFQTVGTLSRTHIADWPNESPSFTVPIREGSDIQPFYCGPPRRALHVDPEAFAAVRARYRPDVYPRVAVVIRQTARFPIAAVHAPRLGFRNSLLAGFTDDPYTLVALLNSTLIRTFHLASQRDGRQAVFPQLKIAHLRSLPAPSKKAKLHALEGLSRDAERLQRTRFEQIAAIRAAMGSNVSVPKGVFVEDRAVREPAIDRWLHSLRGDARDRASIALSDGIPVILDALHAFHDAMAQIDRVVFTAYDVDPNDLNAVDDLARGEPSRTSA